MTSITDIFRIQRTGSGRGDFRMVRKVPTTDARPGRDLGTTRSARASDSLLTPVLTGKVLALGDVWDGVRRYTDMLVKALPLRSPLVPPNILTTDPTGAVLELGHVYAGLDALERFAGQVKDAAIGGEFHESGAERATAVAQWAEALKRVVLSNTPHGSAQQPADGVAFADAQIARRKTTGDFSKPKTPAEINAANAKVWAERAAAPDHCSGNETHANNLRKLRGQGSKSQG
jgi:hypothetical protein